MRQSVIKFQEQQVYYVDTPTQRNVYCSPITLSDEDETNFNLSEINKRLAYVLRLKGFIHRTTLWDSMVVTYHKIEDDGFLSDGKDILYHSRYTG